MTFHKSRKGGFNYPVTVDECVIALNKVKRSYIFSEECMHECSA